MRLALAQTQFAPKTIVDSLNRIEKLAGEASNAGASLIVFPELFVCGYLSVASARELSLTACDLAEQLSPIARIHRVAICTGYSERNGDALHNSALLIDRNGDRVLNYRKMHLWGELEKSLFCPGEPSPVAQVEPGCSVGILICYDLDFPAAMQDLQRRGADIAIAISATDRGYYVVPRMQVRARAYENSICVAFCNHVGGEGDFVGASAIVAPDGSVLARGSETGEDLVVADFNTGDWDRYRSAHRYVDDQRTDYFPLRVLSGNG
ncbi:MAG: nitrilase-related carbon-nitrogen hydrolase [Rhizobiaceae bacterium]